MIQSLIESFKLLIELTDEKKSTIFSWVFFVICTTYFYNDNMSLKEQLRVKDEISAKTINEMQALCNNSCQKQLDDIRQEMQKQLNIYIIKSNQEMDNLYKDVNMQVKEIRSNYKKTVNDFNQIKNESIN